MRTTTACLILVLAASVGGGQAPTHAVTGVAFDSIAGVALAGAVVQAILVDSGIRSRDAAPRSWSTIADVVGHYRLTGLPDGRFAIGFQHASLGAFGIDSPIGGLELGADSVVTFNLAITPDAVFAARPCRSPSARPEPVLGGFVTDSRLQAPIAGASISANWVELGIDKGKLVSLPRRISTTVLEDGSYQLCGVPPSAAVMLEVARKGFRKIDTELMIPDNGVARRDFSLVDSAAARGTAILVGKVVQADGSLVGSGQASISALALDVTIRDGVFSISELPAGSWSVDVKAIGYEEKTLMVDVVEHANTSIVVTMGKKAQTLEAVNVIGKASRDIRTLSDIDDRKRLGGSTVFLPGNEYLEHAQLIADVMRAARGFSQKGEWRVQARPYVTRGGGLKACRMLSATELRQDGEKSIAVYLDGDRYAAGLQMLNNDVLTKQVLAVEAYPDVISVPVQWRTNDACAVIAVWTKH